MHEKLNIKFLEIPQHVYLYAVKAALQAPVERGVRKGVGLLYARHKFYVYRTHGNTVVVRYSGEWNGQY